MSKRHDLSVLRVLKMINAHGPAMVARLSRKITHAMEPSTGEMVSRPWIFVEQWRIPSVVRAAKIC
ncbi:MAG: hypothetical protein ACRCSO_01100 [Sphingomonas sp.]